MNPIDPEEATTLKRMLRKYPCDIEDDRTRLHPDLKVTPEERLILRKYMMAKGCHAAKDAVAELDSMGAATEVVSEAVLAQPRRPSEKILTHVRPEQY